MIVTHSWLKEFVDFDFDADELAHRLTMAGLEVDAVDKLGEGFDSVIVARLRSVSPHPDADRLTVCEVDKGTDTVQVVCGAKNHKQGDLVALAQVGSGLPGDFKIKKSKIRGQVSMGMLCSEKELGLAEDSAGIMILPENLPLGQPVFQALGLKDVRYEIGLTPNRPDCLSVVGVAREIAAMVGREMHLPVNNLPEDVAEIADQASVLVEDPDYCPRYAARLVRSVKIGPSPSWLVRRLEALGMRSINNVVDVTNYVMMELGHPLHAFDFNELREGRIIVKRAREGQSFTTLDSQSRDLKSSDLVICDAGGPVALAGIMGGENSEVQESTTDILLECAYFQPTAIRRTSKRLGIHTESSHRFERGADVNMVPRALDRAAALLHEIASGKVAKGRIDIYPKKIRQRRIQLSLRRTNDLLGLDLDLLEVQRLLRSIELDTKIVSERSGVESLAVAVPTFRPDLEREVDLIEDVARLNGYDRIATTMPAGRMVCHRTPVRRRTQRELRNAMAAAGFSEIINYSFNSPDVLDKILLDPKDERRRQVRLLNPLSEDQAVMRTTLVPSLLETVVKNLAYRSGDLRLFELRPTFHPLAGEELPEEKLRLCAALCGRRHPLSWSQSNEQVDFYDIKGVVEEVCGHFGVSSMSWDSAGSEPYLHPGKSCAIISDGAALGVLGEVHPTVLANFEIDRPVFLLDLNVDTLVSKRRDFDGFKPLSRFPDVYRDSALLVDENVPAQTILDVIEHGKARDVEEVILFDIYRGANIPEGKKSVAVRIRYRSAEKTLTDAEISKIHEKILASLKKQIGAEIR